MFLLKQDIQYIETFCFINWLGYVIQYEPFLYTVCDYTGSVSHYKCLHEQKKKQEHSGTHTNSFTATHKCHHYHLKKKKSLHMYYTWSNTASLQKIMS